MSETQSQDCKQVVGLHTSKGSPQILTLMSSLEDLWDDERGSKVGCILSSFQKKHREVFLILAYLSSLVTAYSGYADWYSLKFRICNRIICFFFLNIDFPNLKITNIHNKHPAIPELTDTQ